MNVQKISSANTSINKTKLPTAFKKFDLLIKGKHICDYGCGKYTSHIRDHVCENGGLSYNPYDPYNMPELENYITEQTGILHGFDLIFCCNVLNVIDNDDTINEIVRHMIHWLNYRGNIIIQIYEGDKTGIIKETKKDCIQRNMKTECYFNIIKPIVENSHMKISRVGNYIIIGNIV